MRKITVLSMVVSSAALLFSSHSGRAAVFNDNCNASTYCLSAVNSSNGGGITSNYIQADLIQSGRLRSYNNDITAAVSALNNGTGQGLTAIAGNNNAIEGTNNRTDWNASVIAALAGNSNGLAYYGNGGIWITGTASKPGGGSWSNSSDVRVKREVKEFHQGLPELARVRPVSFKYNGLGGTEDTGTEYVGVIAQELEKVLPAMVSTMRKKLHKDDAQETDIKQVDPSAFTYLLINAVQEQQKIIERQEDRIAKLERGRGALMSSLVPGGLGGIALGLVPLGFFAARRRRDKVS